MINKKYENMITTIIIIATARITHTHTHTHTHTGVHAYISVSKIWDILKQTRVGMPV